MVQGSEWGKDSQKFPEYFNVWKTNNHRSKALILKLQCAQESPRDLIQMLILIQWDWGVAPESVFLARFQVLLMLLVPWATLIRACLGYPMDLNRLS